MNDTERKQNMNDGLQRLKTLRDEIRLEIHLAGMEAKERWKELEPKVHDAERLAGEAIDELVVRVRALRDTLTDRNPRA